MAVAVLVKFQQGASVGTAGQALIGSTAVAVQVSNGAGAPGPVTVTTFTVIAVPTGSSVPVGVAQTGSITTWSFTPDVSGTYIIEVTVEDEDGNMASDARAFGILTTSGRLIPSFTGDNSSLNFGGQTKGWDLYMESWLQALEGLINAGPFSGNEDTDITLVDGTNMWALPSLTVGTLTLVDGGLSAAAIVQQADTGSYQVTVYNATAFPVFLQGFWDAAPVGVVPVGGTALWCQLSELAFGAGGDPPSQVLTQNQMQLTAPAIVTSSTFLPQPVVSADPLAQITAARTAGFVRFQTSSATPVVAMTIPLPGTTGSKIPALTTPGQILLDVVVQMTSTTTLDCFATKMTWGFVVGTTGSPQAMGTASVGDARGNSVATPQTAPVGWVVTLVLDGGSENILVMVTGDSSLTVDGSAVAEWGELQ